MYTKLPVSYNNMLRISCAMLCEIYSFFFNTEQILFPGSNISLPTVTVGTMGPSFREE